MIVPSFAVCSSACQTSEQVQFLRVVIKHPGFLLNVAGAAAVCKVPSASLWRVSVTWCSREYTLRVDRFYFHRDCM